MTRPSSPVSRRRAAAPLLILAALAVLTGTVANAHEPRHKTGPAVARTGGASTTPGGDGALRAAPAVGRGPTGNPGLASSPGHTLAWWRTRARHNARKYRAEHARWRAEKAHRIRSEQELRRANARARTLQAHRDAATSVEDVIADVFGAYAGEALHVAWCESRYDTGATNGQFLGLMQLGSSERATYAHGRYTTAREQAEAAYRYFVASGRDWSPWDPKCRP